MANFPRFRPVLGQKRMSPALSHSPQLIKRRLRIPLQQTRIANANIIRIASNNLPRSTSAAIGQPEQHQNRHLDNDEDEELPPKPSDLSDLDLILSDEHVAKIFAEKGIQKKPGVRYISTFQRLMHIGQVISHFYNEGAKLLPSNETEESNEQKMDEQPNLHTETKQFLHEILYEYTQLAQEIETFYAEIGNIDMTTAEAMQFFGFDDFYKSIRAKQNVEAKAFVLLEAKLDETVAKFVDKTRKMFAGIYNIRHIDQFLYSELKPYASDYNDLSLFKDPIQKIEQGKKMVSVFIGIKEKAYGFVIDVQEGINACDKIRAELLWTLRAINNIPVMSIEEVNALVSDLEKSSNLWRSLITTLAVIITLVW